MSGWGDDDGDWGDTGGSHNGNNHDDKNQNDNKQAKESSGWGEASSGWGEAEPASFTGRDKSRGDRRNNGFSSPSKRKNPDDEGFRKRRKEENEDGENKDDRPAPYKPEELDLEEEAKLQGGAGELFSRYEEHQITCLPNDVIKPITSFTDVVKSNLLLENISRANYKAMTPIQKWAIPAILDGHDLIACAQTGSGKTAAFLLPVFQTLLTQGLEANDPNCDCKDPYCLVIAPTRELAHQTHVQSELLSRDSILKCQEIYGGIATHHLKSKLSAGCHVLVATPGRLKDFVERGWIGFKNVKYIILDEGDRLVDEGFTSAISSFFDHESMPPPDKRQTLFFSATFKESTQLNARKYLKDNFVFLTVGRIGAANENIKQEFLQVERSNKKRELRKILAEIPPDDKTIIFTQTKTAADMLAGFFNALNLSSTSIHGDRHQSQREQAIRQFRKGDKRFLISSPVGNRGLDLPKVAIVINYDLPDSIDEYVHRIGRTGRAGHTGRAISFFDLSRDSEIVSELLVILEEAKQTIPDWLKAIGSGSSSIPQEDGNDDWGNSGPIETGATDNKDDWGDSGSIQDSTEKDNTSNSDKQTNNDSWDNDNSGW